MNLKPEYAELRKCAKCGAPAMRLGSYSHIEGEYVFEPKDVHVETNEADPLGVTWPYQATEMVRGTEKRVTRYKFYRVYEFLCSRNSKGTQGDGEFDYECGVLMRQHTDPMRPDDELPSYCYEPSAAAVAPAASAPAPAQPTAPDPF